MATKLLSARASLRTALASPSVTKYLNADNPDQVKIGTKAPKQSKSKISKALLTQTGAF